MKLVSFRRPDGRASWGIVNGSGVIDCGAKAASLRDALPQLASLKSDARRRPISSSTPLPCCRRSRTRKKSSASASTT